METRPTTTTRARRVTKERVPRRRHGLWPFFWITKRRNGLSNGRTSLYLTTERAFQVLARISTTGASEYRLNGNVVTYAAYNAALISHNILVKAKNFLVFQGDVEAVASQSPRELTRLIEQISGSLELAAEYDKAKEGQERATDNATFNFTKRRGIVGEIKQYKEQKTEADRFETLCQERVRR